MSMLLLWRLAKFVALLLLGAGTTGAFVARSHALRQWMVHCVATSALALTWVSGFGLTRETGWSIGAPFIAGGVLMSLVWFYVLVRAVERDEPRGALWIAAATLPLLGALALMVHRPA